jgi:GTP1/Obg family GTP-binding protein
MKRVKTTYEQAIKEYREYFKEYPTVNQIDHYYHEYAKNWKHYDGFTDWLTYYTA